MQQGWRVTLARYAFFAWLFLACLISWPLFAAAPRGPAWPLLAMLGPAIAAFIMLALTEGADGVTRIAQGFKPRWRHLPWLIIAILLPVLLIVPTVGVSVITGLSFSLNLAPIDNAIIALALLAVAAEIGWRGYALPLLLRETSPLTASLLCGFAWALWYAPLYVGADSTYTAIQFGLFALLLLAYSVIFTWFWLKTRGSLWVSYALHATLLLVAIDAPPGERLLPRLAIYLLIAFLLSLGRTMRRARMAPATDAPMSSDEVAPA
jgi:uncharacterized protein